MDLRLGLIGRGYWGETYAKELTKLGIDFWQSGRDWKVTPETSGAIVACSTEAHYQVAKDLLQMGVPVLLEKPVTRCSKQAKELLDLSWGRGIAFASHTRLYAPHWPAFKASLPRVESVEAWCGGVNETNPDALWNWLPHVIPLCLDIGFCPKKAVFHITEEKQPFRFVVNGTHEFQDKPGALANLITQFCQAIERGVPDNRGLLLGYEVVKFTEELRCHSRTTPA